MIKVVDVDSSMPIYMRPVSVSLLAIIFRSTDLLIVQPRANILGPWWQVGRGLTAWVQRIRYISSGSGGGIVP